MRFLGTNARAPRTAGVAIGRGAVLWLACASVACKPAVIAHPPDAVALFEQVHRAHASPATLSGDAKAFVDAPENGGRYALHLALKRPASVRIEALTPLGDPAAVLVADQGRFALLDLRNGVFLRGPASADNLARLLPAPLRPEELVALLVGDLPDLPGAEPTEMKRVGDGFVLTVTAPDGAVQEAQVAQDLRVNEVKRTSAAGKLLWAARLDEHDDKSGQQVPRLVHVSIPARKTEVDLKLRNVLVDLPPPSGAFLLGAPAGMQIEDLP